MATLSGPTDNSTGLSGLLSALLAQAAIIQSADDVVDDKANNLMAAALVIVALLATQLKDASGHWQWLPIVAIMGLLTVVGRVIYHTRIQRYLGAAVDLKEHTDYFGMKDDELLAQLIWDAQQANDHNETILGGKQRAFRVSVFLFLAGFGLGMVALFVNA